MTATATRYAPDARRRAMLAKVHLGAKELGLDEDTRRDLLERVTGRRSAGDCSEAQLAAVLDEYKAKGWTPKSAAAREASKRTRPPLRRPADHAVARKARALWISLWNLGAVRDSSEAALEAFARRQLGVTSLQWADQSQGYRLIEALKAMAEREGWSQAGVGAGTESTVGTLKRRLFLAQSKRLTTLGVSHTGAPGWEERIDEAIADYGRRIRMAQAAQG